MTVEQIASEIQKHNTAYKPVMIAIEGFGGSGKSTFAKKLKSKLGYAYVVNIDDFLIKEKISDPIKSNFDRARLEREVLRPIKEGKPAAYRRLDWATNTLSVPIPIPNVNYLIIEGVSSYHPGIEDYYDFKIWIEAPMGVAKERGSKRDRELGFNNDDLWDHWTRTYQEYKNLYGPELKADFVFDNTEPASYGPELH